MQTKVDTFKKILENAFGLHYYEHEIETEKKVSMFREWAASWDCNEGEASQQ